MMEKRTLKILVTGFADTGKSTIAQLIAETLVANGIEVDIQINAEYFINKERQKENLSAISKKTIVSIEERALYKAVTGEDIIRSKGDGEFRKLKPE